MILTHGIIWIYNSSYASGSPPVLGQALWDHMMKRGAVQPHHEKVKIIDPQNPTASQQTSFFLPGGLLVHCFARDQSCAGVPFASPSHNTQDMQHENRKYPSRKSQLKKKSQFLYVFFFWGGGAWMKSSEWPNGYHFHQRSACRSTIITCRLWTPSSCGERQPTKGMW